MLVGSMADNFSQCGISAAYVDTSFDSSYPYFGARSAFYGNPTIVSGSELMAM